MTVAEYAKKVRELTLDLEYAQGTLVGLVTIEPCDGEPNALDVIVTFKD